jgi:hypothetical protein
MSATQSSSSLPCILQVGFAGSRHLFDERLSRTDIHAFEHELEVVLTDRLRSLKNELGLGPNYRLCGVSQIAIGADMIFSRACRTLDIPQRIFLPQQEDAYLSATGHDGTPDFSEIQRHEAGILLHSKHVIERRIVSDALDRNLQFEDTNREIVAKSNIVICLVRVGARNKPGGTAQLIELARERGIATLILEVSVLDGKLGMQDHWVLRENFKTSRAATFRE